jgi:hypothetical protein
VKARPLLVLSQRPEPPCVLAARVEAAPPEANGATLALPADVLRALRLSPGEEAAFLILSS